MKKTITIKAKRLITSAISAIMCLSFVSSSVFAENVQNTSDLTYTNNSMVLVSDDNGDYNTVDDCRLAGEKWITANYSEGTEIRDIIPIRNLNGNLAGYCIDFSTNGAPAGYLVLDANRYADSYILEFSFDGNGIFDELSANVSTMARAESVERTIYATTPYQYAIKFSNNGDAVFYNNDSTIMSYANEVNRYGETIVVNDTTESCASVLDAKDFRDEFFYGYKLTGYESINDVCITGGDSFTPHTMRELLTGTNTENCVPTAATNICDFYAKKRNKTGLIRTNVQTTYNALVTKTYFDIYGSEGALYSYFKKGLKSYIEEQGYTVKIGDYWLDLWSDFKRDFDGGYPNAMAIYGTILVDGEPEDAGHAVVGIGYRILNDDTKYIRVYDGWNASNSRFVKFKSNVISKIEGAVVDIT